MDKRGIWLTHTHQKAPIWWVNTKEQYYVMGKIKAAIMAKKAIMAAELESTEGRNGYIVPSYLGGARNSFEELSKFNSRVSGRKYVSDTKVEKYGRS